MSAIINKNVNEKKLQNKISDFKVRFHNFGGKLYGRVQNLSRAIVLPIAVLPIAGILLGIGGGFSTAFDKLIKSGKMAESLHWLVTIFNVIKSMGEIVFKNLGAVFAISIAFGFAKTSKGVAALSGFITFAVMTIVITNLFAPTSDQQSRAGFDPWQLTKGKSFSDNEIKNSGIFQTVLGIENTFNTGILGGILVGWAVATVHNRFYNIKMPRIFGFFAGERFIPILAVFLGLLLGILFFFLWPILFRTFQILGSSMGRAMNLKSNQSSKLTGEQFKPTFSGALIAFFFGAFERLLVPTGLHHVQYTPFWFTAVGGEWIDKDQKIVTGAYEIFFAQFASKETGQMNQYTGTMFMSGRFAFMQYGYPFAALAMWKLARPENKKMVAGILGSAAFTSFLTGITEPLLFSFLFVAPLCFVWHAILAGVSFMLAYCFNIVVGQGFAAGFIDFCFFGILPEIFKKGTNFYWVFVIGLIMAPAYYFGFYYIIKWKNYKTLGRETNQLATNLALEGVTTALNKNTKKATDKIVNLIKGLGTKVNILDYQLLTPDTLLVKVKDSGVVSDSLIHLSGTKMIKKTDTEIKINYQTDTEMMYQNLKKELQSNFLVNNNRLERIFQGLGGRENIIELDNCATRLRVKVKDDKLVDEAILKETGAFGVVKKAKTVQVIYSTEVGNIKNDLTAIWHQK